MAASPPGSDSDGTGPPVRDATTSGMPKPARRRAATACAGVSEPAPADARTIPRAPDSTAFEIVRKLKFKDGPKAEFLRKEREQIRKDKYGESALYKEYFG